jgi:glycosyltransferase involved in cell wall biosynthesis
MKICFISNHYPTEVDYGGLGTYVYNTAQSLVSHGHEVDIITAGLKNRSYNDKGVNIHAVKPNYFWFEDFHTKKSFNLKAIARDISKIVIDRFFKRIMMATMLNVQVYKKFKELYKKDKFDIVECDDGGGIGLLISFLKNVNLVTKLHTSWALAFKLNEYYNLSNILDIKIIKFLEHQQLKRSKGLTSNSRSLKELTFNTRSIPKSKVKVIYCSMNTSIKNKFSSKKIKGDYILFVGRIEPRKGIDDLVKAIPIILNYAPNIKVVFAGLIGDPGFYRKMTSRLKNFKDKINFLGHLKKEALFRVIKNASVVVLPSPWEAFGFTCLESMALGKIVIASGGSGFEEQIQKDGKNGFLFPPRDSEALASKVIKVLAMPKSKLAKVSRNAKKRAMDFDNKVIIPKLIKYYGGVIKK